jgi:Na+/serine symporter
VGLAPRLDNLVGKVRVGLVAEVVVDRRAGVLVGLLGNLVVKALADLVVAVVVVLVVVLVVETRDQMRDQVVLAPDFKHKRNK